MLWRESQFCRSASDGQYGDQFGSAVAISGGLIAIGAPNVNGGEGMTYTFAQNSASWTQQAELFGLDGMVGDQFGGALALYGSTLVIGAYGTGIETGQVYVFTLSGSIWFPSTVLMAQDGDDLDYFGTSVAFSSGSLAIGAPYANAETGSLYLY